MNEEKSGAKNGERSERTSYLHIWMIIIASIIVCVYLYTQALVVPYSFPVGRTFTIGENETLKSISTRLKQEGYIHSPLLFRAGVSFLGGDRTIQLGGYVFEKPLTLLGIIETFVQKRPTSPLISITVPEGSTSYEVATIVSKSIPKISSDIFGEFISKYMADGKLFPSTYFLLPSYTAEDIVKLMLSTFTKKTEKIILKEEITLPLKNENDVLSLASLLEGEAKSQVDMKIVSGILRTRLTQGMPLQVDVARETYTHKGLPFVPINNPGLIAIDAALHPTSSQYLYYITDTHGIMHYAKTFDEHKSNIKKYLK